MKKEKKEEILKVVEHKKLPAKCPKDNTLLKKRVGEDRYVGKGREYGEYWCPKCMTEYDIV